MDLEANPELITRLTKVQNSRRTPLDIITFAGWCETKAALQGPCRISRGPSHGLVGAQGSSLKGGGMIRNSNQA